MIKKHYDKIAFIYNPYSNKGKGDLTFQKEILPLINKLLNDREIIVKKTTKKGDGTEFSKSLLNENCDLIVACGGDGTINEVVNGIIDKQTKKSLASLCVIPIGTGNDFSRSINFTKQDNTVNYQEIIEAIKLGTTINIDIGEVNNKDSHKFWINSCGVGISGEIINAINNSTSTWIPKDWIFKLQTLYQNLIYTNKEMKYIVNDKDTFNVKSQAIIVSNGKYFGAGMLGSPDAVLNDQNLNYGVLGDIGLIDMLSILPSIYSGNHTKHPKVKIGTCSKIECVPLNESEIIRVETDGELFGYAPCTISIIENVLPIIVFDK